MACCENSVLNQDHLVCNTSDNIPESTNDNKRTAIVFNEQDNESERNPQAKRLRINSPDFLSASSSEPLKVEANYLNTAQSQYSSCDRDSDDHPVGSRSPWLETIKNLFPDKVIFEDRSCTKNVAVERTDNALECFKQSSDVEDRSVTTKQQCSALPKSNLDNSKKTDETCGESADIIETNDALIKSNEFKSICVQLRRKSTGNPDDSTKPEELKIKCNLRRRYSTGSLAPNKVQKIISLKRWLSAPCIPLSCKAKEDYFPTSMTCWKSADLLKDFKAKNLKSLSWWFEKKATSAASSEDLERGVGLAKRCRLYSPVASSEMPTDTRADSPDWSKNEISEPSQWMDPFCDDDDFIYKERSPSPMPFMLMSFDTAVSPLSQSLKDIADTIESIENTTLDDFKDKAVKVESDGRQSKEPPSPKLPVSSGTPLMDITNRYVDDKSSTTDDLVGSETPKMTSGASMRPRTKSADVPRSEKLHNVDTSRRCASVPLQLSSKNERDCHIIAKNLAETYENSLGCQLYSTVPSTSQLFFKNDKNRTETRESSPDWSKTETSEPSQWFDPFCDDDDFVYKERSPSPMPWTSMIEDRWDNTDARSWTSLSAKDLADTIDDIENPAKSYENTSTIEKDDTREIKALSPQPIASTSKQAISERNMGQVQETIKVETMNVATASKTPKNSVKGCGLRSDDASIVSISSPSDADITELSSDDSVQIIETKHDVYECISSDDDEGNIMPSLRDAPYEREPKKERKLIQAKLDAFFTPPNKRSTVQNVTREEYNKVEEELLNLQIELFDSQCKDGEFSQHLTDSGQPFTDPIKKLKKEIQAKEAILANMCIAPIEAKPKLLLDIKPKVFFDVKPNVQQIDSKPTLGVDMKPLMQFEKKVYNLKSPFGIDTKPMMRIERKVFDIKHTLDIKASVSTKIHTKPVNFIPPTMPTMPRWDTILAGINSARPATLGNQGWTTHHYQKSKMTACLKELHDSIHDRPSENTLANDPAGINVPLMNHQKHALAWMIWREKQKVKGGILADDMGLGKTLTMISLVLDEKNQKENQTPRLEKTTTSHKLAIKAGWSTIGSRNKTKGGTLVVCPASLLRQWEYEVYNKIMDDSLKVCVHHGSGRENKPQILSNYDIVVTTYQTVAREQSNDSALFWVDWNRIILDEAHIIRNCRTMLSEAVCKLKGNYKWILTGTPIQNKEKDVYALIKFIKVDPLDDLLYWKTWVEKSGAGHDRLNTVLSAVMLRRTKAELMASGALPMLPSKIIELVKVELHKDEMNIYQMVLTYSQSLFKQFLQQHEEREAYRLYGATPPRCILKKDIEQASNSIHSQFVKMYHGSEIKAHTILVLLLRLRQVCCHPGLISAMLNPEETVKIEGVDSPLPEIDLLQQIKSMDIKEDLSITSLFKADYDESEGAKFSNQILSRSNPVFNLERPSSKMLKVLDMLQKHVLGTTDKAIIVSQWTSVLKLLEKHLTKAGVQTLTFTGEVPIPKRQEIVTAFNQQGNGKQVLLLSLTAGGVGLNLIGGNHLFLFDPHWNPQLEKQASDRIYRFGQLKNVIIYKFICEDTIEERIKLLQEHKLAIADSVLTGSRMALNNKLSIADMKLLFDL